MSDPSSRIVGVHNDREDQQIRRLVPPLGWPISMRFQVVTPADRPRLIMLNRYPRQVIGVALRLPDVLTSGGGARHRQLSLMWTKPARWWVRDV